MSYLGEFALNEVRGMKNWIEIMQDVELTEDMVDEIHTEIHEMKYH